jgi:hypothetical protein
MNIADDLKEGERNYKFVDGKNKLMGSHAFTKAMKKEISQLTFSNNQNFTGALVLFVTDNIMIFRRRSYAWPVASENT